MRSLPAPPLQMQGKGLKVLLGEGTARGLWSEEFAASTRFSADPVIPLPEVREVELTPADEFLVLASDGLWDYMPVADVLRFARQQFKAGRSAEQVAYALTDIALKRYTTDNVAVVVVDMKGEGWTAKPKKAGGSGGGLLGSLFGKK